VTRSLISCARLIRRLGISVGRGLSSIGLVLPLASATAFAALAFIPPLSFGAEAPAAVAGEKKFESDTLPEIEASTRDLISKADALIGELERELVTELDPAATRELLAKVKANRAALYDRLEILRKLRNDH
jgi:hypothetical protein